MKLAMKFFITSSVLLFALFTTAVMAAEISWTGCGITKKAFMSELAAAYEKKLGTTVKLSGGGATKGIRAAAAGTADMGGSCRLWLVKAGAIHSEEKNADLIQVAWDAIVVIANPGNGVEDISLDNLKAVLDGKITNWSQLGGDDKRIALITRQGKTSGVGLMSRLLIYNDADYEYKARSIKVKSTGPLEKKVEKMGTAIAVDGISSAKRRDVKVLSINGVKPTKENIGSGKYVLYRPLYLVLNKSRPNPEARKFIDFALSAEGQKIISEQGTVNLEEGKALNESWQKQKKQYGIN